jgi:trehalose synthase-fused probable maltokinase
MASRTPPSEALAAWLPRQRWFAAKTRRIAGVDVVDRIPLAGGVVAVVAVRLDDGAAERYVVPLGRGDGSALVVDALEDPDFCRALVALAAGEGRAAGERGELRGARTSAFPADARVEAAAVRRLGAEQSNTSFVLGDTLIAKVFRRLADGVNPEQEITAFLTERTTFRGTPPLTGFLEYRRADGAVASLAVVERFVPDARDGWAWMLDELRALFARAAGERAAPTAADLARLAASSLAAAARLGARTAELHRALASDPRDPAFAPEPVSAADVARWAAQVRAQLDAAHAAVGERLVADVPDLAAALAGLVGRARIRHHGDFHLGQTLRTRDDFLIIDFEGEPLRPLAERRRKHCALRDVAGMARSLDYARAAVPDAPAAWAEAWEGAAVAAFVDAYHDAARGAAFLPAADADFRRALAVFELEKAAYEVVYEANQRPAWIAIPRRGLVRAASRLAGTTAGAA